MKYRPPGRCECWPAPHAGVPEAGERGREDAIALTSTPPVASGGVERRTLCPSRYSRAVPAAARRGAWSAPAGRPAGASWSATTACTPSSALHAGTRRTSLSAS